MNAFFITRQEYPLSPVQCTKYAGISTTIKQEKEINVYILERKKKKLFI